MCAGIKIGWTIIKECTNNKYWRGCVWRKVHCWWQCKLAQPLVGGTVLRFLKNEIQSARMISQSRLLGRVQRNPGL